MWKRKGCREPKRYVDDIIPKVPPLESRLAMRQSESLLEVSPVRSSIKRGHQICVSFE